MVFVRHLTAPNVETICARYGNGACAKQAPWPMLLPTPVLHPRGTTHTSRAWHYVANRHRHRHVRLTCLLLTSCSCRAALSFFLALPLVLYSTHSVSILSRSVLVLSLSSTQHSFSFSPTHSSLNGSLQSPTAQMYTRMCDDALARTTGLARTRPRNPAAGTTPHENSIPA